MVNVRFVRQHREAENAFSFLFEPETQVDYQAGQYLRFTLSHPNPDQRGVTRTFTLSSFPTEPLLMLTTRLSTPPSTFKAALASLTPGGTLDTSGPFGRFVYTPTDAPTVFIAGGIGITPIRSILGDLATRRVRANVTVLYSNRTSEVPFHGFLNSLAPDWPQLRTVYTVTRPDGDWQGPSGRIDAAFLQQHLADLTQCVFMVSGPTTLVTGIRAVLAGIGVDDRRVKYESFPGYEQ
jgi:ferredoxin-NADP reductase